jgi:hypothetical protein
VQKHEIELKASRHGKVIGVTAFLLTDGNRQQQNGSLRRVGCLLPR